MSRGGTGHDAAREPRRGGGVRGRPLRIVLLGVLAVGVAAPLIAVVMTGFLGYNDQPPAMGEIFRPGVLTALWNTIVLSIMVVGVATAMAVPLAFLMSWTRLRGLGWLDVLIMVPLMTPPYAAALAWLDFTRRNGLAEQVFGADAGTLLREVIESPFGMALVMGGEIFPFLYLILRNRFDAVSASLDEAAVISQASVFDRVSRVVAPLVSRAYLLGALIVFIRASGEFGTPITIGNQIGYRVLVSEIYAAVTVAPLNFPLAAAMSSLLLALGIMVWCVQQLLARGELPPGSRVARRRTIKLGGWVILPLLWFGFVMVFTAVIPYISIVIGAMTVLRSEPLSLANLTFDYFAIVLSDRVAVQALSNSVIYAFGGTVVAVVSGVIVALVLHAGRGRMTKGIGILSVTPDMVPAMVFAIGLILFWNAAFLPFTLYNTPGILVIGYGVLFLPMVVQNVLSVRASIDERLLEAARVAGAGRIAVLLRIVMPLLLPGIFAGGTIAFVIGVREVVVSSIARPASTNLLSPWIIGTFGQGDRAEAMAMTVIGVLGSTAVLVTVEAMRQVRARRRVA